MRPDLATLFSGTNDVLRARFDLEGFRADVELMQSALRTGGATVLTFTLPDLSPLLPLARWFAARILAMNDAVRQASSRTGTRLVDFAAHPVATDARLWNEDRIHANAAGHARIADALAEALGLEGSGGAWRDPLPALPPPGFATSAARELRWGARHLVPWCWRALSPRAGVAHRPGKRPELTPLEPGAESS